MANPINNVDEVIAKSLGGNFLSMMEVYESMGKTVYFPSKETMAMLANIPNVSKNKP